MENINKLKKCVFTIIINDYCNIYDNHFKTEDWDYFCITDDKQMKSSFWEMIYVENESKTAIEHAKISKFYKTNYDIFFKDYDLILYVDGRIAINCDLNDYAKNIDNNDIFFMKHKAKSIKEHYNTILNNKYETEEMINNIKKRYEIHNYTYNNGLISGGIILFKNNERTKKFFDYWWNEIKNYSHRDQLSANFAIFKTPELKYCLDKIWPEDFKKYFKLLPRKHKRLTIK